MKKWALIAIAIGISWILDQAGWLKPLLVWSGYFVVGGCAIVGALLVLGLTVMWRKQARENAANEAQALKKKQWADALAAAHDKCLNGDWNEGVAELEALGSEGLGDAFQLLSTLRSEESSPHYDPELAIKHLEQGIQAPNWIINGTSDCRQKVEDCRFFGIGCAPQFVQLRRDWESTFFPGDSREVELAWIYAYGKGVDRDLEQAWYWLSLREKRHASQPPPRLPDGDLEGIRGYLEQRLSEKRRRRIEIEAEDAAYREFVSTR